MKRRAALALGAVLVLVTVLYAPLFGGFWLGDDLANLHQLHVFGQQHRLLAGSLSFFSSGLSPQGSFYRPLSIVSLALNYAVAGSHYPGWIAANIAVHLANVVLVALLVQRICARLGLQARHAAWLAAACFGLAPALAEGVFWVSARADGWVTLLCLAGTLAWCGGSAQTARTAWCLPLCLLPALLFKESAAVLPLQVALLAMAWPQRTTPAQRAALLASFVLMLAFLAARASLFGNAWQVYAAPDAAPVALDVARLLHAWTSFAPWWHTLTANTPGAAALYAGLAALLLPAGALVLRGSAARMGVALGCAAGGMLLAALLNLGGMPPTGDGGRLTYTPLAWLAVALGVALAAARPGRMRALTWLVCVALVASGAWVAHGVVGTARAAQDQVRALAAALAPWATQHPGLSILLVPERFGPVVTMRNAQGGLALRPLQTEGLLHSVLPTLPDELTVRHAQLAAGLGTRLASARPQWLDMPGLLALLEPAPVLWPAQFACWSADARRIVPLPPPRLDSAQVWQADLDRAWRERCAGAPDGM